MGKTKFLISSTGAILAWVAVIQFYVANSAGKPFLPFLAEFFTYFTIIGNVAIALYFTVQTLNIRKKLTTIFYHPGTSTAILAYSTLVAIGYHTLFEDMYEPENINISIDLLLHLILPVLFLLYWLIFEAQKVINWKIIPYFLILPFFYFLYVLMVGALFGHYPYPFFDIEDSGYGEVMLFGLGFSFAIILTGAVYIGLAKALRKNHEKI